jgi:myo-inositol-1(or 4)-monophosphatase
MDSLLSTALEAAEVAAAVHLHYFGRLGVEGAQEKGHSDFVSRVDLEAQDAALQVIARNHPHPVVLAEEEGSAERPLLEPGGWPEGAEHLWIVDPLDGTTNYLHRHPQFAASVGVWSRPHESVASSESISSIVMEAGAVVAPRTGERWWARRGRGAFKNGRRIRVSATRSLRAALIGTGFPFKEPTLVPRYLEEFGRVLPASGGIRRGGSAALDLCYLAEGILDAFWEEDYLSPWDVAAGLVILSEAGGVATRLDGSAIDLAPGSILAANSPYLQEALAALVHTR